MGAGRAILHVGIHINIYVYFLHVSIYIYSYKHDFWTRCLQIFTHQHSVIVPAQPLEYSLFEMSLLSSELSEDTKHPPGHTDASKSEVKQDIRELSHLQGRQEWCERTHYIQRAGVRAPKTDSPGKFQNNLIKREALGRGVREARQYWHRN